MTTRRLRRLAVRFWVSLKIELLHLQKRLEDCKRFRVFVVNVLCGNLSCRRTARSTDTQTVFLRYASGDVFGACICPPLTCRRDDRCTGLDWDCVCIFGDFGGCPLVCKLLGTCRI